MNPFLQILFPRVSRGLVRLREVVGLNPNTNMPRLSTEEEIAVIEGAVSAITTQREVIAQLREQLGSLPQENAELQAALAAADASDAETDEKLSSLKALLEPEPTPEA